MLPQIKQNMYLLKVNYELNEISKKVKAISAKRLTIDLINGYKIFKDAKYFFLRNISKLFRIYTNQKTH